MSKISKNDNYEIYGIERNRTDVLLKVKIVQKVQNFEWSIDHEHTPRCVNADQSWENGFENTQQLPFILVKSFNQFAVMYQAVKTS